MRDPTTNLIGRVDEGCFHFSASTAICWCLWSELNRWPGCPWSSLSCPQGWPQELVGAASFLLPIPPPPLWSSDAYTPFPTEVSQGVWRAEPVLSRRKAPSGCQCPTLALGYLTASTSPLLPSSLRKRKIRLGLRSIDLPIFSWLREVTSHLQSQRERLIHFSFSAEAQGDELWLGGKTIGQVYQRNMFWIYDLLSIWGPPEHLDGAFPLWTLIHPVPHSLRRFSWGERREIFGRVTHLTPGTAWLWAWKTVTDFLLLN